MTATLLRMTTTKPAHAGQPSVARTLGRRALAVLGGSAAALTVWTVAVPFGGAELTVGMNGATQEVGPLAVLAASLFAGLAGVALLGALERMGRRPRLTWTITAVALLVLSLAGPLGNGDHTASIVALVAMHLAVGATLIPALRRSARC